jgi:hypothetical protein
MEETKGKIAQMSYAKSAGTLLYLERHGCKRQTEMAALCERAAETAPPRERALWNRRLKVYRAGRIVQWRTFPVRIIEPPSNELVEDVESAFQNGDES